MFYVRFAEDTSLIVKVKNTNDALNPFNNFDNV